MDLPLFVWKCCNCNAHFDAVGCVENYGEFLMRSKSGELRFLNAIDSNEFNELAAIVDSSDMVKMLTADGRAEAIQAIFSNVCDNDSTGRPFNIALPPQCKTCGSFNVDLCDPDSGPFRRVNVDAPSPTHFAWNRLGKSEKVKAVSNELSEFIANNPSAIRADSSWG